MGVMLLFSAFHNHSVRSSEGPCRLQWGKQSLHLHLLLFLSKPQRNCKEKEANLTNTVCNAPVATFSKCLEVVGEIVGRKENSLFFTFPCEHFDLLFLPGLTIKACRATEAL